MRRVLVTLLLMLLPAFAHAANYCTTSATGPCTTPRYATIQEALTAAMAAGASSHTVVIGPGAYTEDVAGSVKLVVWQPGAWLTGATPGGAAWLDTGLATKHELRDPVIFPAPGGVGIQASTGFWLYVLRPEIQCPVEGGVGIWLTGGMKHQVQAAEGIRGCTYGIHAQNVTGGLKLQANVIHENTVGIEIDGVAVGQVFFNDLQGNATAIRARAVDHTDVNSNEIVCALDGVGFEAELSDAGAVSSLTEVNNNHVSGCAAAFRARLCDRTWGAYTDTPEDRAQYGSNEVDGVGIPNYNSPASAGC